MKATLVKGVFVLCVLFAGFAATSCSSSDDDEKVTSPEIEGYWKLGASWCVKISGTEGRLVLFDNTVPMYEGFDKFVKIGDVTIKDLKKVVDNMWTGKEMGFFKTTEGEVTHIVWFDVTYSLSDDGKELERYIADRGTQTYHKVEKPTDDIPTRE